MYVIFFLGAGTGVDTLARAGTTYGWNNDLVAAGSDEKKGVGAGGKGKLSNNGKYFFNTKLLK